MRLLPKVNERTNRFVIDNTGVITTASVGTSAIVNGAVTQAKRATATSSTVVTTGNINQHSPGNQLNGQSITLTTNGRPVLITWQGLYFNSSGANQYACIALRIDGSQVMSTCSSHVANGQAAPASIIWTATPSAASHTFQVYSTGGGDNSGSTYWAGANRIYFSVSEL